MNYQLNKPAASPAASSQERALTERLFARFRVPFSGSRTSKPARGLVPIWAFLLTFVLAWTLPHAAFAQETGTITGKVLSAKTQTALSSAEITIHGQNIRVLTDSDGTFRISQLAPGSYTVAASYTDLDPEARTVTLGAGETQHIEFELASELYILEAFVVAAEREGQAHAVQQQRQSDVMKNIVASDAFGNLIDTNAGELLKNLPGIFVDYAGEDVGGFSIRGISSDDATFTMDGNSFANSSTNPESSNPRGVALKNFSVAAIETVEVYKVPPPSSPANANGGVVNMVSKNAFDQKGRRVTLTTNVNLNSAALDFGGSAGGNRESDRKWGPGFNLYYSEAFLNNRFGVSLNINAYEFYRFNNQLGDLGVTYPFKPADELPTADTLVYTSDYRASEAASRKQQRSTTLNLDYKLSPRTAIYLKTSYNDGKTLSGYSHSIRMNNGVVDTSNPTIETRDAQNASFTVSIGGAPSRQGYNEAWSVNPGVKHNFSWGKLDYDVYTSRAFTRGATGIQSINYTSPVGHYILTGIGSEKGATIEQVNPVNGGYLNLDNYTGLTVYERDQLMVDERDGGKIDIKIPVSLLGHPLRISAGGLFSRWERNSHSYQYDWTLNSGASTPGYSEFYDPVFGSSWKYDNSVVADWISPWKVADYFYANQNPDGSNAMFTLNKTTYDRSLWRYTRRTEEKILAGYIMGSWQINELNIMAGTRYEHTDAESTGWQTNSLLPSSDPNYYSLVTGRKKYGNLFPNVQLKYEPLKDLIFRAAWTNTIARPGFNYLIPSNSVSENATDERTYITASNTNLKPQRSRNYDVSVEYYFPNAGLLSVGAFRKEMTDYILSRSGFMAEVAPELLQYYPQEDYRFPIWVTTAQNVGEATMQGFEMSYRQQLRFLPGFLKNFDVYQSFTYADPAGDIPIENMKRKVSNSRLTYRGKSWYATVSYSWCDEYLRRNPSSIGNEQDGTLKLGDDGVYVQPSGRWDMSVAYQFSRIWTLSFDWRNFTNEPDRWERFGRVVRYFEGGTTMNLSLKANF